jgi:acyl-coenzyme A thioesterase PaaI-like protein
MNFDVIRSYLGSAVPFARHSRVNIDEVADGRAVTSLPFWPDGLNHIGTLHAGALFTVGEAASGAAMAGAFGPVLTEVKPVAGEASIRHLKSAKGSVLAKALIAGETKALLARLHAEGKVAFPVHVELLDAVNGERLAEMTVQWHVAAIKE